MSEPATYLVAHLHQALLDALCEQAVEIVLADGRLVVRGEVATPQRHDALLDILARHAPDADIVDDVRVSTIASGPPEAEHL